uniref:cytochrome P450 Tp4149-like n=1 Tax=Erigeron canadensis TaxID=72917 RepID=UPI001CB993F1|nr:cytochrome P450 Tp4149-like [Erigeron canadensis]
MGLLTRSQQLLAAFVVGNYIPWLSWVDGLKRGTDKVAKEFDEFLDVVIDEHINNNIKAEDANGGNEQGQLDLDVFFAGTETTSASIEWTLSELVRHPHIMKKLQTEVTKIAQGRSMVTEDDTHEMPYLKAVLKEGLRLYPPITVLVPRELRADVNLMGYDIAKGTQVMINGWAISRDPSIWEEPE